MVKEVFDKHKQRMIVSTHPRIRKRLDACRAELKRRVALVKRFGFIDYVKFQVNAHAVLSDSGAISEESSILNFRALNIRDAYERVEAMEEGAVMLTGLDWRSVEKGLSILEDQPVGENRLLRLVADYAAPNVSQKVVRNILSYTDYINFFVWHKRTEGPQVPL